MELSYDSAIPLLAIYPKEVKAGTQDIYTAIFTAALVTTAKRWKQSSIHQQMNG